MSSFNTWVKDFCFFRGKLTMLVKHNTHTCGNFAAKLLVLGMLIAAPLSADSYTPYKVDMSRTEPGKEIRKSAIMTKVRELYPGRILSIRENRDGGPDCHIVKSMGEDGEFRIIHVACN